MPILFWRRGMTPAEVARPVESVDIAPTLAAIADLHLHTGDMDGKCLPEVTACH